MSHLKYPSRGLLLWKTSHNTIISIMLSLQNSYKILSHIHIIEIRITVSQDVMIIVLVFILVIPHIPSDSLLHPIRLRTKYYACIIGDELHNSGLIAIYAFQSTSTLVFIDAFITTGTLYISVPRAIALSGVKTISCVSYPALLTSSVKSP